jgi:hypothetical protein
MRYIVPALAVFVLAAAGAPGAVRARTVPATATQRPEVFEAVVRCRTIAGDAERLRCFDAAAAAMQQAAERHDLVVVDRQQVRATRRTLFGIELPRLPFFGGGDEDKQDEISQIDGVIDGAYQDGSGRWIFRLKDGGTWAQVDDNVIALRPRAGDKVLVKRAALGSYMLRVGNQPGVRVKRQL